MSQLTTAMVIDALRPVKDPELGISIVDLGLLRGIELKKASSDVTVKLTLTSPACPMGPEIVAGVQYALSSFPDIKDPKVELVWDPPWNPYTDMDEDVLADLGFW